MPTAGRRGPPTDSTEHETDDATTLIHDTTTQRFTTDRTEDDSSDSTSNGQPADAGATRAASRLRWHTGDGGESP